MKRRLKQRYLQYRAGELHRDIFEQQLNSWLGHANQADTWRLREKVFYRLRGMGLNVVLRPNKSWVILEVLFK